MFIVLFWLVAEYLLFMTMEFVLFVFTILKD